MTSAAEIDLAARFLRRGRLVAFPTETVYGLGADATNPAAIGAIYATKGRPGTNPLIVHVADVDLARRCVAHWPERAQRLAEYFWPGPLTLVLPKSLPTHDSGPNTQDAGLRTQDFLIPDNATAGLQTVGVRVPNHPVALALLRELGRPVAAPSANRSNRVSPTTARHVLDEFPESAAAGGPVDRDPALVLDGGPCDVGIESTVLDLIGDVPIVLRPGGVTPADLEPVVGPVVLASDLPNPTEPARSPGQQHVHYAPRTPAYRFDTSQRGLIHPENHGLLILSPLRVFKEYGKIIAMPNEPGWYGRVLYGVLRKLDAIGLKALFIEMPPDVPEWRAVRDRLLRATVPMRVP